MFAVLCNSSDILENVGWRVDRPATFECCIRYTLSKRSCHPASDARYEHRSCIEIFHPKQQLRDIGAEQETHSLVQAYGGGEDGDITLSKMVIASLDLGYLPNGMA